MRPSCLLRNRQSKKIVIMCDLLKDLVDFLIVNCVCRFCFSFMLIIIRKINDYVILPFLKAWFSYGSNN